MEKAANVRTKKDRNEQIGIENNQFSIQVGWLHANHTGTVCIPCNMVAHITNISRVLLHDIALEQAPTVKKPIQSSKTDRGSAINMRGHQYHVHRSVHTTGRAILTSNRPGVCSESSENASKFFKIKDCDSSPVFYLMRRMLRVYIAIPSANHVPVRVHDCLQAIFHIGVSHRARLSQSGLSCHCYRNRSTDLLVCDSIHTNTGLIACEPGVPPSEWSRLLVN